MIEDPWALTAEALSKEYAVEGAHAYTELVRLSKTLDLGRLGLPALWRKFSNIFEIRAPYNYFRRLVLDNSLVRILPVWDSIRLLRQSNGFQIFALSNMSRPVWKSLQRKFAIESLFDGRILSHECGILKPNPKIFKLALKRTHLQSEESAFLDDSGVNITTASSLRFRVHLASSPADTARFLKSINPEWGKPTTHRS